MKSVRVRSTLGTNARKYGPENLRIRTLFVQCCSVNNDINVLSKKSNKVSQKLVSEADHMREIGYFQIAPKSDHSFTWFGKTVNSSKNKTLNYRNPNWLT